MVKSNRPVCTGLITIPIQNPVKKWKENAIESFSHTRKWYQTWPFQLYWSSTSGDKDQGIAIWMTDDNPWIDQVRLDCQWSHSTHISVNSSSRMQLTESKWQSIVCFVFLSLLEENPANRDTKWVIVHSQNNQISNDPLSQIRVTIVTKSEFQDLFERTLCDVFSPKCYENNRHRSQCSPPHIRNTISPLF